MTEIDSLPWTQQKGEPNLWFSRFHRYLLMPGRRSLLEIFNSEMVGKGGKRRKSIPNSWETAIKKYNWKSRVEAWDKEQRRLDEQKWRDRKEEWKQHQWEDAIALRSKAAQMLLFPLVSMVAEDGVTQITPARWTFRDVPAYREIADRLAKSATGMDTCQTDELEALKILVDAGWIPQTILEEAGEGLASLRERMQQAFINTVSKNEISIVPKIN